MTRHSKGLDHWLLVLLIRLLSFIPRTMNWQRKEGRCMCMYIYNLHISYWYPVWGVLFETNCYMGSLYIARGLLSWPGEDSHGSHTYTHTHNIRATFWPTVLIFFKPFFSCHQLLTDLLFGLWLGSLFTVTWGHILSVCTCNNYSQWHCLQTLVRVQVWLYIHSISICVILVYHS